MKKDKKSFAALVGAGIVTTLSAGVVSAAENPFALADLSQGYAVAEAAADAAKKPEMKCGADMMKGNPEMKCGAGMMGGGAAAPDAKKATEMKCAGMKMDKPATPAAPPAAPAAPAEAPKAQ